MSVSQPLPPTALRRPHAQTVRDSTSSYKKRLFHNDLEHCKSQRASKSLLWFKSSSHFTEGVDWAYWWSCIGKGLRLQPAQKAFFFAYLHSSLSLYLFFSLYLSWFVWENRYRQSVVIEFVQTSEFKHPLLIQCLPVNPWKCTIIITNVIHSC